MRTEDAAPNGAENYLGLGFYKYAAPNGAGMARPRRDTATGTGRSPAMTQWVAVRQVGRLQKPGQRQFGVDERAKERLNELQEFDVATKA